MKNQYFGDVNDYLKYGVLRGLATELQVGVCWMLTPDDGRPDGLKTRYLADPARWRRFDPYLFDWLATALAKHEGRNIRSAEDERLLPGMRFYRDIVPDQSPTRREWFARALDALAGTDLIFFDPDNGFEVSSKPPGRKDSSKYLYWEEVEAVWNRGFSVLVFQHFAREERTSHVRRLADRLGSHARGASVTPIRTANVLFLLASQPGHAARVEPALSRIVTSSPRLIWVDDVAV